MTVLAFDVNETLLDLRALDAPFAAAFGDASLRPLWFSIMLQVAFVGGLTGSYVDFTTAQRTALAYLPVDTRLPEALRRLFAGNVAPMRSRIIVYFAVARPCSSIGAS